MKAIVSREGDMIGFIVCLKLSHGGVFNGLMERGIPFVYVSIKDLHTLMDNDNFFIINDFKKIIDYERSDF